jgi:hypothetical protein
MFDLQLVRDDELPPVLDLKRKSTIRCSNLSSNKSFEAKLMGHRALLELMMQTQTMLENYEGTKHSPKIIKKLRKIDTKAWLYFDRMVDAMEEIVATESPAAANDLLTQLEEEVFTPTIMKLNLLNRKRAEVTGSGDY